MDRVFFFYFRTFSQSIWLLSSKRKSESRFFFFFFFMTLNDKLLLSSIFLSTGMTRVVVDYHRSLLRFRITPDVNYFTVSVENSSGDVSCIDVFTKSFTRTHTHTRTCVHTQIYYRLYNSWKTYSLLYDMPRLKTSNLSC